MKIILLTLFLISLEIKVFAKKIFNAEEFSLKNGMRVIVVENKRAPVVAQMIWYDFGSGVEEKGKSGLAHFMEHLMFKGTEKFPENFFSNYISKIGGTENAFTSFDYTAYYQIFPSSEIEKMIEMEADRMKNLTLTKKNVEIEREVILEERFQRIESDPSSQLDESMRTVLFPNNYYGRPIIGWKHEIENLDYEDVMDFYKKYYNPSNAILILSGDIDEKKAKKLTNKYYGKIPTSKKLEIRSLVNPEMKSLATIRLNNQNVEQPIWKKFYRVVPYSESIEEGIALDIGLKILSGGSSSLLYEQLVNKKKLFSSVGGFYQGLSKLEGYGYFYAIPNENVRMEEINDIMQNEIKKCIDEMITLERFEIEKNKYIFDSIYGMDGIIQPAQMIGEAMTTGLNLKEIKDWNKKLNSISLDDVLSALKKIYKNKNNVLGFLEN